MTRALWLTLLAFTACTRLDPDVTYPCTAARECHDAQLTCWADGYCRAGVEPRDAGSADAGPDAGTDDAGAHDAGAEDAGAADAGVEDAGVFCECAATIECGHFDAGPGCGELFCGTCGPGRECGVTSPNACGEVRLCRPDGWCVENPFPQGSTLNALWSPDGRRVFLAGDDATLLEWDGERHRYVSFPPALDVDGIDFRSVHGVSADDFFVVGTHGTVLHFIDGGWQREVLDSVVDVRLDLVLAGAPAVALGAGTTVFVRDGGAWESRNVSGGFGGGVFNDVVQSASGVKYALGHSVTGNAELSGWSPGDRWWLLRDGRLGLVNASSLVEVGTELFLAGARPDGGGALARWSPDAGVHAMVHFDEPLRSVRSGDGELLVLRAGKVARVPLALARTPESLVWSAGLLRTLSGATTFPDGGPLPAAPVEFPAPGLLNASALTAHGWLAEGVGGLAAFAPRDGGLVMLSGGVRGPRVADLCDDDGTLYGPAAAPCATGVCTQRVFERDAGTWALKDVLRRDGGELGAMLRCQATPLGRVIGTDTSRTLVRFNGSSMWVDDFPGPMMPARDFWASNFARGWFVNPGQSLSASSGPLATVPAFVVPFDAGGDDALAVGGVFHQRAFAAGERGLLLALEDDGGVGPVQRLGVETLHSVAGVELRDGGAVLLLAGEHGALYRHDDDAGFVAVPFDPEVNLSQVVLSAEGDVVLSGKHADGGAGRPLFWGPAGGPFVEVPHQGSTRPAVFVRRDDAGVEAWLGGEQGRVLHRRLP